MGNLATKAGSPVAGKQESGVAGRNSWKSLNTLQTEDVNFPNSINLKWKNKHPVLIASKNLLTNSAAQPSKSSAKAKEITFKTEDNSSFEESKNDQQSKSRGEDNFEESERIKIKRPKFARMTIDQDQFIVMKKTPIKDDYELTKKIGKGAYGSVYRSKEKSSGELRAIKVIEKVRLNKDEYDSLVNEFEILRRMDHPNIIKLYQIYDDRKNMYVVTQLCEGGSLIDIMNKFTLSEEEIRVIMVQILSAITYMHGQKVMHKDVKPENIVVVNKITKATVTDIQLKFIDFGISIDMNKKEDVDPEVLHGTLMYMPPECFNGTIELGWDIWSCGIICYMMSTKNHPYRQVRGEAMMDEIEKGNIVRRHMQSLPRELKVFIMGLLTKSYLFRLTAEKALKDTWLNKMTKAKMSNDRANNTMAQLNNYEAANNLISMIEGYLVCKKINQSERQHLAAIFESIDGDNSGIIEVEEFKKFYAENSEHYDVDEVEKMVLSIDKNNSGKIDFNQFITAMCNKRKLFQLESLAEAFDFFDKDKSGHLEKHEIRELLAGVQNQEVEYMFQLLDSNNDDSISKTEFIAYFEKIIEK